MNFYENKGNFMKNRTTINHKVQRDKSNRFKEDTSEKVVSLIGKLNGKDLELGCMSNCLSVEKAFGFGARLVPTRYTIPSYDSYGNVIGNEKVTQVTTTIVGYAVKNISDRDINYMTEEFSEMVVEGKKTYVGKRIQKVLKPNETTILSKLYFNILLLMPEFNCQISNGFLKPTGKYPDLGEYDGLSELEELNDRLLRLYFVLNPSKEEGSLTKLHSYTKEEIAIPDERGVYKVMEPYLSVFGNLANIQNSGRGDNKVGGYKMKQAMAKAMAVDLV